MGYDMNQIVEHPRAAQAKKQHNEEFERLEALRLSLVDEGEKWYTPEEVATLGEEAAQELGKKRCAEWTYNYRQDPKNDMDYESLKEAAQKAAPVPPSEAHVRVNREWNEHLNKAIPFDSYFRLNIWGMGRYRNQMEQLGMGVWDYEPGDWPKAPDGDVYYTLDDYLYDLDSTAPNFEEQVAKTIEDKIADKADIDLTVVTTWIALRKERDEYLTKRGTTKGIALHKFCSNDGWLVTAEECAEAVAIWDALPKRGRQAVVKELGDYWLAWIDYLRRGASGRGFRVH